MKPERWQQIERLYHEALDRKPEERAAFLDASSGEDTALVHEVHSLLHQPSDDDSRLERPAWQCKEEAPVSRYAAGAELGAYRIEAPLGAGGMGEVFRARDTRLDRTVAIKVSQRRFTGRFRHEAQTVAALNHPNIVQIFELESDGSDDFIVMEFVPGRTLTQVLRDAPLSIEQALDYSCQIASALAAAHSAGIVHRDIKTGNVMVNDAGVVKVLDFGLAKMEHTEMASGGTHETETAPGTVFGTAAYMSPEQAQGRSMDARSDIFSTGSVLYEMFSGSRAFEGDSTLAVLSRVLHDTPRGIREVRPEVPQALERIVARAMEKDPGKRFASGAELAAQLAHYRRPARAALTSRAGILVFAMLITALSLSGWLYYRNWRARWIRDEALPGIRALIAKDDMLGAFDLTRTALRYAADDPQLKEYWSELSVAVNLASTPAGATVLYRPYGEAAVPWKPVGQTPLPNVPMSHAYMWVRVEKAGFEPVEFATFGGVLAGKNIPLSPAGGVPAGMVSIPSSHSWTGPDRTMELPSYFLDKFEVTNRQFKAFVDGGGYRDARNWRHTFRRQGRDAPFEEALPLLRDATGRPGPSGWELGAFPQNQGDLPVSGVSWYEAVAYCESLGKALPTVHHWRKAAGIGIVAEILRFSNFAGVGPARVGANTGVSALGAYDMAGNVKEWCWNPAGERRAILGGGWNEPRYMYSSEDAQDPLARAPAYGFRCALYPEQVPAQAFAPVGRPVRDYDTEKPVGNDLFEVFRRLYAYDKTPLDPKTDSADESSEYFRKERVSYSAAYAGERIPAILYLPRNERPPYQAVVWAPGGYAFGIRSIENAPIEYFKFLLRTGRAVLYPVYKGTFERRGQAAAGPNETRERTVQFVKDAFRSVDFLESRSEIRKAGVAYYGLSTGATLGTLILALEPRFKAGILIAGGMAGENVIPEVDLLNFAPRVLAPTLMLNGRYDFVYPPGSSQLPLFRLIGTPEGQKRLVQFDSGHMPPIRDVEREILDWLDRNLGPVEIRQ
jgi:eukaryotic-like serine/threonine-protein kinase